MDNIRSVLFLGTNNIRRWAYNPKYYTIAILAVLWMHFIVGSLSSFTNSVGVNATPWVFPFLFSQRYTPMLLMIGIIVIFSDAPFINLSTPYELIRSGKRNWVKAQISYVVFTSFIWVVFLFIVSILCLLPNLDFSWEWGKVYRTLAQTNAAAEFSVNLAVSYDIILGFTPIQATIYSFVLVFLEMTFLGMLIFTFSAVFSRSIALFTSFILAFMPAGLALSGMPAFYYFTPTAWSDLLLFVPGNSLDYPPLNYCILFLTISIIVLIIISIILAPKKETKVLLPV